MGQYANSYNANDVHLFVDNKEVSAFQNGTMVQVQWPQDLQKLSVDAKGVGFMSESNDRRANMTINLSEMSQDNARFQKLMASGKTFPVVLVHKKEKVTATVAQFQKAPNVAFGDAATGRSWTILMPKADYTNDNQ